MHATAIVVFCVVEVVVSAIDLNVNLCVGMTIRLISMTRTSWLAEGKMMQEVYHHIPMT